MLLFLPALFVPFIVWRCECFVYRFLGVFIFLIAENLPGNPTELESGLERNCEEEVNKYFGERSEEAPPRKSEWGFGSCQKGEPLAGVRWGGGGDTQISLGFSSLLAKHALKQCFPPPQTYSNGSFGVSLAKRTWLTCQVPAFLIPCEEMHIISHHV